MHTLLNLDLFEVVNTLAADTGLDLDTVKYVSRRLKNEGVAFLTVTLPKLSKAVISSIEVGYFDRSTLTAFSWYSKSLRYFRSFLDNIFDLETGLLLADFDIYAVANLRQFCEYFYKLSLSFTTTQLEKAEQKYIDVEHENAQQTYDNDWVVAVRKNLHTYYSAYMDTDINSVLSKHRPRFGKGTFAGHTSNRDKFFIHKLLPSKVAGLTSKSFNAMSGYFKGYPSSGEDINLIEEDRLCTVCFVPKDSRGPRVISQEPLHNLRAQLAHLDWAVEVLENCTNGRIQFKDQSISRKLALEGSITRRWSTLDLKDASDRVTYGLVRALFQHSKAPLWFIKNCRSTHAKLPVSGEILRLNKLSGMGSGLTFPIMALIIHSSICTSVAQRTNLSYRYVSQRVTVYGDDVIVPTCWYDFAISGLSRSGLLVNTEKSFFRGPFRESCGGDYINGIDVTPVRLKLNGAGLDVPSVYRKGAIRIQSDQGILNLDRHCRELSHKNLVNTQLYYEGRLSAYFDGVYPIVSGETSALGRYRPDVYRDNIKVEAYFPLPKMERVANKRCPYKFLGSFFNRAPSEDITLAASFDLIAVSRAIRLKKRLATGTQLY